MIPSALLSCFTLATALAYAEPVPNELPGKRATCSGKQVLAKFDDLDPDKLDENLTIGVYKGLNYSFPLGHPLGSSPPAIRVKSRPYTAAATVDIFSNMFAKPYTITALDSTSTFSLGGFFFACTVGHSIPRSCDVNVTGFAANGKVIKSEIANFEAPAVPSDLVDMAGVAEGFDRVHSMTFAPINVADDFFDYYYDNFRYILCD